MDKIVQRRQNPPIRMCNLQLLRKALVNRGGLTVGDRISEDSVGLHKLPLAKEFARQGIANFRRILTPPRCTIDNRETGAKLSQNFSRGAARRLTG